MRVGDEKQKGGGAFAARTRRGASRRAGEYFFLEVYMHCVCRAVDGCGDVVWYCIPNLRRVLGVVFQDFKLLQDRTIGENLKFVLTLIIFNIL